MVKIYQGPTGCGKTYQAFNRLNKRQRAIYLAPCRQLVYETAMKYGNSSSHIATSDIKIGDAKTARLSFRTYEACFVRDLKNIDVLIIDEAHFMRDRERGEHLVELMTSMHKAGKVVVLLSATLNFTVDGAKVINLPARGQSFAKKEISYKEALDRASKGVPTLVFHRKRTDCGNVANLLGIKRVGIITAETSVQDRIRLVNLFNKGDLTILEATNAMAQGVNVPCENMIMFYNSYDDAAVVVQKMGRLGRTGVTREGAYLTYCFADLRKGKEYVEDCQEEIEYVADIHHINPNIRVHSKYGARDFDLLHPSTDLDRRKTTTLIKNAWRKE